MSRRDSIDPVVRVQRLAGRGALVWLPLACVAVSYLLVWQRGLNYDDYGHHNWAVDVVTGQWHPVLFGFGERWLGFMAFVNLAGIQPRWEFLVRVFSALMMATNALLLAWLIYRLTRLRLVAVLTGWLFVVPVYAYEAAVYLVGIQYSLAFCFALLFLHASCLALTQPRMATRWSILAGLLFLLAVLSNEQAALSAVVVPFLGLYFAGRGEAVSKRFTLKTSLGILILPAVVTVALFSLYRQSGGIAAQRGGIIFEPHAILEHIGLFASQLANLTVSPNDGQRVMTQAFELGYSRLRWSLKVTALFASTFAFLVVALLAWNSNRESDRRDVASVVALCCGGIVWSILAWLLPGGLVRNQWLASRLLYMPLAGVCVSLAGLIWLVVRRLQHPGAERAALGLVGVILILSTVCMVGFARTYQERSLLDRRQIAAVLKAVPPQYLPADSHIVPFRMGETLPMVGDHLGQRVAGVMEQSWSATAALQQAYQRSDIATAATNRWIPMRISYGAQEQILTLSGSDGATTVPVERTVFVTYQDGVGQAIERLTLKQADGSQQTIRFPIAEALRAAGLPTTENIVVQAR